MVLWRLRWSKPPVGAHFLLEFWFVERFLLNRRFGTFTRPKDFYFILIISFSALPSRGPRTPSVIQQRRSQPAKTPPSFLTQWSQGGGARRAKRATIFHVFSHPSLQAAGSVSSSEPACLPPAKAIIYIAALAALCTETKRRNMSNVPLIPSAV